MLHILKMHGIVIIFPWKTKTLKENIPSKCRHNLG